MAEEGFLRGKVAWVKGASLQQKMTMMLLVIVLQSMLFTGGIMMVGNMYLRRFNTIMNDCYAINQLLSAYSTEVDSFHTYVLYGGEQAYADYLAARSRSIRAIEQVDITYKESGDQFLLLQAIDTSYESFRAACDETAFKRVGGSDYAHAYDRALRAGQYIESYIKNLLQLAIAQGQEVYQRNMVQFRILPLFFLFSLALSFVAIMLWTRWTVRHVVSPINDLIQATGAMSANQYDAPDIVVYEEDEIAQLARMVNEMKHSTARLVESLQVQREYENKLHAEEVRRMRMEATMDTLRLSLLQSQINPHFLFNTLNIISRMAQMEDAPTTEDLIVRLANLFRYNLQSVDDIVPLSNELKIVEDYIAIQKIRFGERIAFALHCTVDPRAYTVPVFTLQPLIENAVIHGISPMEEGGTVSVDIGLADGALVIAVQDTGVGISPEQLEKLLSVEAGTRTHVSGLGLGNARARIETHYPGSSFRIESALETGTRIEITIPLQEVETDV